MERAKVYDCFTFFNELELLEIRLEELYNYVDYFVIVEGDKTHSGNKKEFIFEKNKNRYKKYLDKIVYIKAKMPSLNSFFNSNYFSNLNKIKIFSIFINRFGLGRWKLEHYQRNQIKLGLKNINDEDIIMISDLDEIPNPKKFKLMRDILKKDNLVGFQHKFCLFYLNGFVSNDWIGTKAVNFRVFKERFKSSAENVRIQRNIFLSRQEKGTKIIKGGWHFSYLGGMEAVIKKLESIADGIQKVNPKKEDINLMIKKGEFANTKVYYQKDLKFLPPRLKKNLIKYKKYIHLA